MISSFDFLLLDAIETVGEPTVTDIHKYLHSKGRPMTRREIAGHLFWAIRKGYVIQSGDTPMIFDLTEDGHHAWMNYSSEG